MKFKQWIVWERTGRLSAALRRMAGTGTSVREVRLQEELADELSTCRASIVVIDAGVTDPQKLAESILQITHPDRGPRVAIVTPDPIMATLLREAGAAAILSSLAEVERLRPWLARTARASASLRDAVWARLPWSFSGMPDTLTEKES